MKTNQNLFLLISFLVISITACQKDPIIDPSPTPTNVINENDSIYLSKYYDIDVNNSTNDTLTRVTFNYDNLKRVISVYDTSFSLYFSPLNKTYIKKEFFYNGIDTLPFKMLEIGFQNNTSIGILKDTTITFFTFNISGQRTKDSSMQNTFNITYQPTQQQSYSIRKIIQDFSYIGNKMYNTRKITTLLNSNGGTGIQISKDTATLDANDNIIEEKNGIYTSTITYDSKPSPFSKLNIRKIQNLPNFTDYVEGISSLRSPNNNILKVRQTNYNNPYVFNNDNTGNYTYKTNGLPSILITDPSPSSYLKTLFIYKSF